MGFIFYALKYLNLRKDGLSHLAYRDIAPALFILICLSAPFILIRGSNYFGAQGFLERISTLSSALTGFFVAALVAVATFSDKIGDLDTPIEFGKIYSRDMNGKYQPLTRREYVCYMFGYLSFMCLFISVFSILTLVIYTPAKQTIFTLLARYDAEKYYARDIIRTAGIVFFNGLLSHTIVTTCHGLYYMIERIYAKAPTLMPRSSKTKRGGGEIDT